MSETIDSGSIRTIPKLHLTPLNDPVEMSPGIFGLRLPLPFILDHVNVWLLRDGPGWTLIDTGIDDRPTRSYWSERLAQGLDERPVDRLIATHFHPDHMGLAGWLTERTGAAFWATRTEWLLARTLIQDTSVAFIEAGRRFDHRAGLDPDRIAARASRGNLYRTRAGAPPSIYRRLKEGDELQIDGETWQVLIGRGHAPEMISLYSPGRAVLIAADQVLQRISPNISVWPAEPDADPLADYIESLDAYRNLPDTTLVLPSHGQPFHGLHARIDQLIEHHRERLDLAFDAAGDGSTAVQIMPALFDRELDEHQIGFALGEAIAHLNHLVNRGVLSREADSAGVHRYSKA